MWIDRTFFDQNRTELTRTDKKKKKNFFKMSSSDVVDTKNDALLEAEAVIRILESELGSAAETMEEFAITVKKTDTITKANAHEVMNMMHKSQSNEIICVDARTPKEYQEGHIPGAYNLPLFSDEERVTVGTLFKNSGRSKAMTAGMDVVRPKFDSLVETAQELISLHNSSSSSTSSSSTTTSSNTTTSSTPTSNTSSKNSNTIIVHCWRGGMRSHALAYLLQTRGNFEQVIVLEGGYKAFRSWARLVYCYIPINASYTFSLTRPNQSQNGKRKRELQRERAKSKKSNRKNQKKKEFLKNITAEGLEKRRIAMEKKEILLEKEDKIAEELRIFNLNQSQKEWNENYTVGPPIIIVGGSSGSGKTRVLLAMKHQLNCQVIDLEGVANHNGSAFGFVGHTEQPTNQQYSNNIAIEWYKLDATRPVYIEDEGSAIGKVSVPVGLYRLMRSTTLVVRLVVPQQARISVLLHDYTTVGDKDTQTGKLSEQWKQNMEKGVRSLQKKIGNVKMNLLIQDLYAENYSSFAETALSYYDGLYAKHIKNAEGSGNGAGTRSSQMIDVIVDEHCVDVNGIVVGQQIIDVIEERSKDEKNDEK